MYTYPYGVRSASPWHIPLPLRDSVLCCDQFSCQRVMHCSPSQLQKEKGLGFNLGAGNLNAMPVVLIGWIKLISRKEPSLDKCRDLRGKKTNKKNVFDFVERHPFTFYWRQEQSDRFMVQSFNKSIKVQTCFSFQWCS